MRFTTSKLAVFIVGSTVIGTPSLSMAQTSVSLSGLYACERITDKDEQLACFQTETAKLRVLTTPDAVPVMEKRSVTSAPTRSAPKIKTDTVAIVPEEVMPTPPVESKQEKKKKKKKAKNPDKQTLVIKSATRYGSKRYVEFTMENGDVWRQTQPGRVRLESGQTNSLTIKKASFGSYLARVNDTGTAFRVRQAK